MHRQDCQVLVGPTFSNMFSGGKSKQSKSNIRYTNTRVSSPPPQRTTCERLVADDEFMLGSCPDHNCVYSHQIQIILPHHQPPRLTSPQITSPHNQPYHITSQPTTSHHIRSHHITSHCTTSHHITPPPTPRFHTGLVQNLFGGAYYVFYPELSPSARPGSM